MDNKYPHITEAGYAMMEEIPPGTLLRVKWIEDTDDVDGAEWGTNMLYFDHEGDQIDDINNVVMLIRWRPEIANAIDIINFDCLWQDKLYSCSSYALVEVLNSYEKCT